MQNIIIIAILIVVLFFAIRSTIGHFKGQGACCGGGTSYKAKPRKLEGKKMGEETLHVEGMMCQNCVNHVTEAVHNIPGTSAKVNLNQGTVTVSYDRDVDFAEIKKSIESKGYKII